MPLNYSEIYYSQDKDRNIENDIGFNLSIKTFGKRWKNNYEVTMNEAGVYIYQNKVKLGRELADGSFSLVRELRGYDQVSNPIYLPNGDVETYDVSVIGTQPLLHSGSLKSRKNLHGIGWVQSRDSATWITTITHTNGKTIKIKPVGNSTTEITDPAGNVYTLKSNGQRLIEIIYPNNLGKKHSIMEKMEQVRINLLEFPLMENVIQLISTMVKEQYKVAAVMERKLLN